MKWYLFDTKTNMKPYNAQKYWIHNNFKEEVFAESISDAMKKWNEIATDKYGISVSKNAMKNKEPMYYEGADGNPVQCGYVITGKTRIEDTSQYVDLWVTIWTTCKLS